MVQNKQSDNFVDLFLKIQRAARELDRSINQALGISINEYLLLEVISETPMSQKQIAEDLTLSEASISKIVYSLEKNELVGRASAGKDRRQNLINLTDPGRQKLNLARVVVKSIEFSFK